MAHLPLKGIFYLNSAVENVLSRIRGYPQGIMMIMTCLTSLQYSSHHIIWIKYNRATVQMNAQAITQSLTHVSVWFLFLNPTRGSFSPLTVERRGDLFWTPPRSSSPPTWSSAAELMAGLQEQTHSHSPLSAWCNQVPAAISKTLLGHNMLDLVYLSNQSWLTHLGWNKIRALTEESFVCVCIHIYI